MEPAIAHLEWLYKTWAWAEKNWQKLALAAVGVAVLGLGIAFFTWRKDVAETTASEQLSALRPPPGPGGAFVPIPADAYLKVANEHAGTAAAGRALLLAAGALFAENKYADAKTQFDRFLRDAPESPLRSQALFGSAACLEALGKNEEAAAAFKNLVDHYAADAVAPRAKLALARSYEAQKQIEKAFGLYEDLARAESYSTVGLLAEVRLEELKRANPALATRALTNTVPVPPTVKTNKP